MKLLFKKIYIILLVLILTQSKVIARDNSALYTSENISNYFLGIISTKNYDNNITHKYLKKVKLLSNNHSRYNVEFIRTLVLLGKIEKAFAFSETVWNKNELFFERDLLLGLNLFEKKDYKNAEKYFERLNQIAKYNLYYGDFIGNVLIAWSKALQGKKEESFKTLEAIPRPYRHLKKTQKGFLKCYFNTEDTKIFLRK